MQRAPRDPKLPILTGELVFRIFFDGFLMLVGGFCLLELAEWRGMDVDRARTIAVNVLIFTEISYLFKCRSLNYSALRVGLFTILWPFARVAVMVILQMLFTHLHKANFIFKSAPIGLADWAKILGFTLLVYFLVEIEKALRQRRKQKNKNHRGLSNEIILEFDNYLVFFRDLFPSASGATAHYRW